MRRRDAQRPLLGEPSLVQEGGLRQHRPGAPVHRLSRGRGGPGPTIQNGFGRPHLPVRPRPRGTLLGLVCAGDLDEPNSDRDPRGTPRARERPGANARRARPSGARDGTRSGLRGATESVLVEEERGAADVGGARSPGGRRPAARSRARGARGPIPGRETRRARPADSSDGLDWSLSRLGHALAAHPAVRALVTLGGASAVAGARGRKARSVPAAAHALVVDAVCAGVGEIMRGPRGAALGAAGALVFLQQATEGSQHEEECEKSRHAGSVAARGPVREQDREHRELGSWDRAAALEPSGQFADRDGRRITHANFVGGVEPRRRGVFTKSLLASSAPRLP